MAEGQKRQSVGGKFGLLSFQAVLFGADRVRERPPRYSNQIAVQLGVGRLDLAIYKAGIDQYSALIIDAADGSKKAKSAMDKQRGVVIKMYTQLGHYVEAACNDDLATFNTSGFTQQVKTKTAAEPVTGTRFKWIDR